MAKIGVIGDKDSVSGFRALGVVVRAVTNGDEGAKALRELASQECAAIYVVESLAQEMMPAIREYSSSPLPAVVLIPGNRGSLGIGMAKVKSAVEKAVGADILFGKEGR